MAKQPAKISPGLRVMRDRLFEQLPDDGLYTQSRAMAAHVGRLAEAVEAMERLAESPNPTETTARHASRVAEAGKKVQQRVAVVWDHINELGQDGTVSIQQRITETANLRPNEFAQEIRASVREMKPEGRRDVLHHAVKNGDAATVAALVNAPSVVTGLDAQYADRMKQAYIEQHAPKETAALTALSDTMSTAFSAASAAKQSAREATDPQYIAKIQREAEAAEAAQSDFNQALSE